jgi:hypothetical protein
MPKITMAQWLASLGEDALVDLLARRPDVVDPPPPTLSHLADRLCTARSVRLAVERLDRMHVDLLAAAQNVEGEVTVDSVRDKIDKPLDREVIVAALRDLWDLGLVWSADGVVFELPVPLRGRLRDVVPMHLRPRDPRLRDVGQDTIDVAAGAAVLSTVRGVAQLIDVCSAEPIQLLRTGGVGVKEVRRVAKVLGADETRVRLWLTLAYHADLVDNDDGQIVPTDDADTWLAGKPVEQFLTLLWTWWDMPGSATVPDSTGKLSAVLTHAYHDDDRLMRQFIARWFAGQPDGTVVTDRAELLATVCWQRPYLFGEPHTGADAVNATIAEAERLGVLAQDGLSSWGRALALGGDVGVVERWLPDPTDAVRLQADLSAVVTGIPTPELSQLLDLVADAGERDTASVWRFSPSSVRRALDAGYTVDRLLAELTRFATHDVPQPLEYLVRDVGRRHGELSVVPVGCCVLADDPALLLEIVGHRSLAELKPRLLAPGVLATSKSVKDTTAALRRHGYAPVALSTSGAPVIERAKPRRARNHVGSVRVVRRQPPVAPADLHLLVSTLLDRGLADPETTAELGRFGGHLSDVELALLTSAIEAETPVEITYVDQNGRPTRRVITPFGHDGNRLEAWCHLRDDERMFLISRIQRVLTPQAS